MEIIRTANAGVLLKTDGLSILLDGVCGRVEPYVETPGEIRAELTERLPDIIAFTHTHDDHYDSDYTALYKEATLRPVYGSEVFFLQEGKVKISAVPTRHIGKADIFHLSYVIEAEKCIWFMGDASPLEWKSMEKAPAPDIIIVPFAYANTASAWKKTKSLGAKDVIILHLPERGNDPYGLWEAVEKNTGNDSSVHIPQMGETIIL